MLWCCTRNRLASQLLNTWSDLCYNFAKSTSFKYFNIYESYWYLRSWCSVQINPCFKVTSKLDIPVSFEWGLQLYWFIVFQSWKQLSSDVSPPTIYYFHTKEINTFQPQNSVSTLDNTCHMHPLSWKTLLQKYSQSNSKAESRINMPQKFSPLQSFTLL